MEVGFECPSHEQPIWPPNIQGWLDPATQVQGGYVAQGLRQSGCPLLFFKKYY